MTGSTIVFDIGKLFSNYASTTSLTIKLCQFDDKAGKFNVVSSTGTTAIAEGDTSSPFTLYVSLDNYTLTKIPDAAVNVIPYTIGANNGGAKFGYQGSSTDKMQIGGLAKGVVVKVSHTPISWWVMAIILLIFVSCNIIFSMSFL
jgi:hypothetical protein